MIEKIDEYRYRFMKAPDYLIPLYKRCEKCNEPLTNEIYNQVEERKCINHKKKTSFWMINQNNFGHYNCLIKLQKSDNIKYMTKLDQQWEEI
jgi:hypothetical protein